MSVAGQEAFHNTPLQMPFSIQCFSNRCRVHHESPVACGDVVEDVGNFTHSWSAAVH